MASKKKIARGKSAPLNERVVSGALEISAREGWEAVSIARIAEGIDEPLGSIIASYPTTDEIVSAIVRRNDKEVLSQVKKADLSEPTRDRLFEILMLRFDALQSHRDAHISLLKAKMHRPVNQLIGVPTILHSMRLMLTAAGVEASGLIGVARVHALAIAYASVLRTWIKDDSADLGQTMSVLDKSIGRLAQLNSMISKPRGCGRKNAAAETKDA